MWWATSDVGWIVGHSYMVYAPLLAGCTTVVFEGALDHPTPIAPLAARGGGLRRHRHLHLADGRPAAAALRRGRAGAGVDHATLERVVCAGEVLNPQAWEWLQNTVLGGRVPVIDHMWQTETGGPVFGNPYGMAHDADQARRGGIAVAGHRGGVVTLDGARARRARRGSW